MPVVDPRSVIPNKPVTPQPQTWPGAQYPTAADPLRTQAQSNANTRTALDVKQDARSDEELRMRREREARDAAEFAAKQAQRNARGGVESTEGERKSGAHAFNLRRGMDFITQLQQQNPDALKPGIRETLGQLSSNAWIQDASIPSEVREARMAMNNAYRDFVQEAIYSASGAAFNQNEMDNMLRDIVPSYWDTPKTLESKRYMMETKIGAAMLQAGATAQQVEQALQTFRQTSAPVFSPKFASQAADPSAPSGLGSDVKSTPVPEAMQQEYAKAMSQIKPGELTPERYQYLVNELYHKNGFEVGGAPENIKKVVDYFNKTGKFGKIPARQEQLPAVAKPFAEAGADKGLTGDAYALVMNAANAGSGGLPMLLAGEGGREAARVANEAHPISSTVGDLAGSVAPTVALEAGLTKAGLKSPVVADALANMIYGGARGNNDDTGAAMGAVGGGLGSLGGRALTYGARGFMGRDMAEALDTLGQERTFQIPGRDPLPVTDATPVRLQSMSDEELRRELAKTQQGISTWDAFHAQNADMDARFAASKAERDARLGPILEANKNDPSRMAWLRSRGYDNPSTMPEVKARLEAMAEQEWPTTIESLYRKDPEAVGQIFQPINTPPSLEPKDLLQQRRSVLQDYLNTPDVPTEGKIPGVDFSTLQRAGLHGLEEAFGRVPGVSGERTRTISEFGRQNAARALEKAGIALPDNIQGGAEINRFMKEELGKKYEALLPQISGQVSRNFENGLAAVRLKAGGIGRNGDFAPMWGKVEGILDKFAPDGRFDGKAYQDVRSRLDDLADEWATKETVPGDRLRSEYREAAGYVRDIMRLMENQVAEANPAIAQRLRGVNSGYAQFKAIIRASNKALQREKNYAPDEYLQALKDLDPSLDDVRTATGQGLDNDYAEMAKKAIGNKPKEGTRIVEAMLPLSLGAGAWLSPVATGAVAGTAALGYTPGVKRVVQAIIDGRLGKAANAIPNLSSKVENSKILQQLLANYGRRMGQGE